MFLGWNSGKLQVPYRSSALGCCLREKRIDCGSSLGQWTRDMHRSPYSMSTRHLSTQESLPACEKLEVLGKQWPGISLELGKKGHISWTETMAEPAYGRTSCISRVPVQDTQGPERLDKPTQEDVSIPTSTPMPGDSLTSEA